MYTDEEIKNIFNGHILNKDYFERYVNIYKYYKTHDCDSDKFAHHHFYPVNYTRELLKRKNRYWTIEEHDNQYDIENNIVKIPIKWHVIAHFCLAMASLRTDDINSFYTLIGNFDKNIYLYSFDEVQEIAQLVEENSQPNMIEHYLTQKERKDMYKQTAKEYKEKYILEHKEEIKQKKQEYKNKLKEYNEQWKKEHKEEIDEIKRKQKEFMKKLKENYKKSK